MINLLAFIFVGTFMMDPSIAKSPCTVARPCGFDFPSRRVGHAYLNMKKYCKGFGEPDVIYELVNRGLTSWVYICVIPKEEKKK